MLQPAIKLPQKKATAWVAETTVDATREWLSSLPMADSNEIVRELYRSLYTLNRIDLAATTRQRILELYRTPVNTIVATLQSQLGQQPLPLTPELSRIAEIARELVREMSTGYKIVVVNLHGSWRQRLFRKSMATPIERAVRYLGELLVHSYHIYAPHPPLVWLEVNELFRYAQQLGVENVPVEIHARKGVGTTNVSERYCQICLLGLTNPYQLPHGEARKVHNFLYKWAESAQIRMPDATSPAPGNFYIDLLHDGPPVVSRNPVDSGMMKRVRVLDVTPLNKKIKSYVRRLENGEAAANLGLGGKCLDNACLDMFRRLLASWDEVGLRQHSRSQGKGRVSMCIGLESAHFFADGRRPFSPPSGLESSVAQDNQISDDDESHYIDFDVPITADDGEAITLSEDPLKADNFRISRWEVLDQSASGMLLRSRQSPGMRIRVGDMLGVQFDDNSDGVWWPAVVRRMQGEPSGEIEAGVELLASGYEPVALRALDGSSPFKQALLLPELKTPDSHRPQSLVFPRGAFREQTDLQMVVNYDNRMRKVRPLKLVERSGSFEQIFFADVMEQGA